VNALPEKVEEEFSEELKKAEKMIEGGNKPKPEDSTFLKAAISNTLLHDEDGPFEGYNSEKIAELMIKAGIKVTIDALSTIVSYQNPQLLKLALEKGNVEDINQQARKEPYKGEFPITIAVKEAVENIEKMFDFGELEYQFERAVNIIKMLREYGARQDVKDVRGKTLREILEEEKGVARERAKEYSFFKRRAYRQAYLEYIRRVEEALGL
jgi:hypothetical protein